MSLTKYALPALLSLMITTAVPGFTMAQVSKSAELHARGQAAVKAEQVRSKQPLCPKASNTVEIDQCYSAELQMTDANYLKLARALGALMRGGNETAQKGAPTRIPFDDAETAWHTYLDQACSAAGSQYEGGTMRPMVEIGCKITVTQHHMDELWQLYSDLGTR